MKKSESYKFRIDRFCTVWISDYISIEAKNKEEAKNILLKDFNDYCEGNGLLDKDSPISFDEVELCPESETIIDIEHTRGKPTVIAFDEDENRIIDNGYKNTYKNRVL